MTYELYIWGPAFGLPSIDPECIAAVAFCRHAIQDSSRWSVTPGHDPISLPSQRYPALYDSTAGTWSGGYDDIARHLGTHRKDQDWEKLSDKSGQKHADHVAFSSHIRSTARPLIDASLYLSSINYTQSTRPAYTAILPWYLNYTVPPFHRKAAQARTAHLGLSSLDAEVAEEQRKKDEAATVEGRTLNSLETDRPSLLKGLRKQTIRGMLSTSQYAGRFRLEALTTACLEPLEIFYGTKNWLLDTGEMTSLDCLAFGYLSLMLYPELGNGWLRDTMRDKFTKICRFVERMKSELFSIQPIVVADVMARRRIHESEGSENAREMGNDIPWYPAVPAQMTETASLLGRQLLAQLYVLNGAKVLHEDQASHTAEEQVSTQRSLLSRPSTIACILLSSILGTGALVTYSNTNLIRSSESEDKRNPLKEMDESRRALDALFP